MWGSSEWTVRSAIFPLPIWYVWHPHVSLWYRVQSGEEMPTFHCPTYASEVLQVFSRQHLENLEKSPKVREGTFNPLILYSQICRGVQAAQKTCYHCQTQRDTDSWRVRVAAGTVQHCITLRTTGIFRREFTCQLIPLRGSDLPCSPSHLQVG